MQIFSNSTEEKLNAAEEKLEIASAVAIATQFIVNKRLTLFIEAKKLMEKHKAADKNPDFPYDKYSLDEQLNLLEQWIGYQYDHTQPLAPEAEPAIIDPNGNFNYTLGCGVPILLGLAPMVAATMVGSTVYDAVSRGATGIPEAYAGPLGLIAFAPAFWIPFKICYSITDSALMHLSRKDIIEQLHPQLCKEFDDMMKMMAEYVVDQHSLNETSETTLQDHNALKALSEIVNVIERQHLAPLKTELKAMTHAFVLVREAYLDLEKIRLEHNEQQEQERQRNPLKKWEETKRRFNQAYADLQTGHNFFSSNRDAAGNDREEKGIPELRQKIATALHNLGISHAESEALDLAIGHNKANEPEH